jgi:hypothetical protein
MTTTNQHEQAGAGIAGQGVTRALPEGVPGDGQPAAARLTTEQVWQALAKASFAVLGHVTPAGGTPLQRRRLQDRRAAANATFLKSDRQRLAVAVAVRAVAGPIPRGGRAR